MCHGTCTQAAVCLSVGSSQPASQPVSHDPPQPPLPYRLFRSKSQSLAAQPAVVNDEQATTSAPAQMLRPMFFASSLCSSSDQWRCGNRRALGESRVSENSTFFLVCVCVEEAHFLRPLRYPKTTCPSTQETSVPYPSGRCGVAAPACAAACCSKV
ncbi:hypothetical protein IWZ00DRAFT_515234 [Phyllosticta capitalensis]